MAQASGKDPHARASRLQRASGRCDSFGSGLGVLQGLIAGDVVFPGSPAYCRTVADSLRTLVLL
jgi:hypothetical protein